MKRPFLLVLVAWICAWSYAQTTEQAELKVHYTFASTSSVVGDHTGTLQGGASLTTVAGLPVLTLGASNGYFDMGASVGDIIATLDDFTISTNVYIPSTTALGSNGNFIYTFANSTNIGSDRNGCIFFGANETRYTICLTNYQAEKNVIANYRFPTGDWHTLTYRQADNEGELFLDGAEVATNTISINPSQLGATPYNFIGRPCYQGDVYLKDAQYNDFRIYDGAVSDATVAELTQNTAMLNSELYTSQITALIESVTLDATVLYEDIALPTPSSNGITVTWSSSDESVVSSTGVVNRPVYGSSDATVTLTATFSKGGISKQKTFTVTVPAAMDDSASVKADIDAIDIKGHLDNLMTNLYLPTTGQEGSTIAWTSSEPSYLSHEGELLKQPTNGKQHVQLTAKASKGTASQSKTWDIYIAQKQQMEYYLFAYFNGNSQWQEQICFALSTDGYNYTPLNNGDPIINSADISLKQAVRDPHILRGEDGYFYMVVTDMRSSQGWSSNDGMVLLRSADMVNWTHTAIDFPTRWPERFDRDALTQVWAPQTIYDPEEGKYMVYYAIGESGKNYITYYSYANEDFTDLTEPQVLYNHGGDNTIDADIVWHDGLYHMFFKTEGQGNGIQKATTKTLHGEWTPEYKYLQQTSVAVEGSGVFRLIDSDTWVLMYDCYTSGMYEYCTSTDLSNFTKKCNSANTSIFTPRHGTTIAITAEEAQRLIQKWPSEGLSINSWIDITDAYIQNPRFDGNSTQGWEYTSDALSQQTGYEGMEFWNGTFDIHQTITVPNGKYRLSAQAYYRTGDNSIAYERYAAGTETIPAYLYANDSQSPIASVYSEYLTENYANSCWGTRASGWTYYYYPNGMVSGAYCFEQGMYNNSVEVEVTDGTLTIGIAGNTYENSNWCMMDNFRLEYYGKVTPITGITLSRSIQTMIEGESVQLTATITPDNATYRKLTWTSDNEQIATVDATGKVTAIKEGTTVIYAHATDDSGISAKCRVVVRSSFPTSESLIINEIQSANIDMYVDPSFNYGAWVELYNPTSKAVSLNGLYISDDASNLTKHRLSNAGILPAKGYHVLWFDHHHYTYAPSQVNFKLDYDGGTIYISTSDGEVIATQDFPMAVPRTSYARTTDGTGEWSRTAGPTPGKSNATSTFATERLEAPVVDKDACLFTDPFTVNVQIPSGATLRYTTDGTTPTLANGNTSSNGRFTVNSTTTYRFCLFQEGKLPSQVITRSYLYKDRDYTLPIISVVTDPINLYDDSLGVYVQGVNGRTGNGQSTPCNWNMDWDRPVNFEYITPDGGMVVNQEVDFAMCGGWSRAWAPHSFKLKAGKIYEGYNSIDYPFFADKPYLKHKTLQIRNGGNDTDCRIKDPALQEIVHRSGLDVDGQHTQPVMHFINGQYVSMLNMREPNNKHYAYANWGIDTDEMDQFEMSPDSGYVQMEGDREAFLRWYALSANAADEATYEAIRELVDIDEYINYMAVEFYLGGNDWPQNNIKGFRPRTEGGRFRFVMFDLDGTLATTSPFYTFEGKQNYTFDYIYDMGGQLTEEIELVTIFLNMLENDSFRKQFIDTYCLVAGSVFEPERCNAIIDEMAARIAPALALEGRSPYGTANQLKNSLANRQGSMINALIDYWRMGLSADMKQEITLSANVEGAALRVNDMEVPTGKFSGTLFAPITLKAEPKAGYRFVGWSSESSTVQSTLLAKSSTWKYYDQGSLDGKNWTASGYSTTSWSSGQAPLGYYTGDNSNSRGYNTTLDYGTDANAKRPTYYFRTTFKLTDAPASGDAFVLNYTVDDGMVVYVNGQEAARYLMPDGTITYDTYASTYANNNPDNGTITLPASLFKRGTNTIAVEVHNNNATSSDIYFDCALLHTTTDATGSIVSEEAEYVPTGNATLIAVYEPLTAEELAEESNRPVRINELSADNTIYVNEYYKKNDWIELYNTTDEPIDVAGMYLSDNLDEPAKYVIEGSGVNTLIEPHGYLIIWPDKLMTFTQLHAPFKLAAEGGYVTLTSADLAWGDTIYYEPHLGIESVGLYPDGSNDVYVMAKPTIAKANVINSYAAWLEQPEIPDNEQGIESVATEELQLLFADNTLHISSANAAMVTAVLYTPAGQQCLRVTTELTGGRATIALDALARGTYIVSASDSEGNVETLKLKIE